MAEPITIARPYAEAIFKIAREANALTAWSDTLANIDHVMADARIQAQINDPNNNHEQRSQLILGVIGHVLDDLGRSLVNVLIHDRRLALAPHIRTLYESLKREHEGVLEVAVITAQAIDDAQIAGLVSALQEKYKQRITISVVVDATLIGGVKIVIGDKVIDATVRGKLDSMAATLTH